MKPTALLLGHERKRALAVQRRVTVRAQHEHIGPVLQQLLLQLLRGEVARHNEISRGVRGGLGRELRQVVRPARREGLV